MTARSSFLRQLRWLAALAVAVAAACAPFHRGGEPAPATIIFSNQSMDEADVYGIQQGADAVRLGTVMAGRTDTLLVPRELLLPGGNVRIVARILARAIAPGTGEVTLSPGETYAVTLPTDERMLSFLPQ